MVNQNLEIVKIAFAIIAPRSSELLLDVGMASLLLTHCNGLQLKYVRRSETASQQEMKVSLSLGFKQWYDMSAE